MPDLPETSGDYDPPPIPDNVAPDVRLQLKMGEWSTRAMLSDNRRRERRADERHNEIVKLVTPRPEPDAPPSLLARFLAGPAMKNPAVQLMFGSALTTVFTSGAAAILYALFHWTGLPSTPTPVPVTPATVVAG